MKNVIKSLEGKYFSTYAFVGQNNCQELANKVLGFGWEADDDCNQIQGIIDAMNIGRYSVYPTDGGDNIKVTEL